MTKLIFAAAAAACVCAAPVGAQDVSSGYHGMAGVVAASFDGIEFWDRGYDLSGGIDVVYNRFISGRGDVGLTWFPVNDDEFRAQAGLSDDAEVSGGSLLAVSGFAHGKLTLPLGPVQPYLLAGLGYIAFSASEITVTQGGAEMTGESMKMDPQLAYDGGVGIGVELGMGFTAFAEGVYVSTLGGDSYMPLRVGATLVVP